MALMNFFEGWAGERRRLRPAAGLSLILCAALTACSGGGSGGQDAEDAAAGPGTQASAPASGSEGGGGGEGSAAVVPPGEQHPVTEDGGAVPPPLEVAVPPGQPGGPVTPLPDVQPPGEGATPVPTPVPTPTPTPAQAPGPLSAARAQALAAIHAPHRTTGGRPANPADPAVGQLTPAVPGALNIVRIELGQTHMLVNGWQQWPARVANGREELLRLKPLQSALAVVDLSTTQAVDPVIEAWFDGTRVGQVALNPPSRLPRTEDDGPKYRDHSYSAVLPAAFIDRGVQLKVSASNLAAGNALPLDVTADVAVTTRLLPFFFFGATEANSGRSASQANGSAQAQRELQARLPFWITTALHPAGKVMMDTVSVGPIKDQEPARLVRASEDPRAKEINEAMFWSNWILKANGESGMALQIYAPVAYRFSDGRVKSSNTGGVAYEGGSWGSAGDWDFAGVMIHEMGHNFGLPHAAGAYDTGVYPYPGGSLKGSQWGWDSVHELLLPAFVPSSSGNAANCKTLTEVQFDDQGRCVKQDIMQGGAGWQAQGQRFGPISDFNEAVMQRNALAKDVWPMGQDAQGNPLFMKQNAVTREYEPYTPVTTSYGAYGIAGNLPRRMGVPVYTLMMSFSMTTPEVNQIHAPLHYLGNLLHTLDPTNADDLAALAPGKGIYRQYCHQYGCDFTVRVTYADGSQRHQLVQAGLRAWWSPSGPVTTESQNPLNGASFKEFAVNVPGDQRLVKVELLYTPDGWQGLPEHPQVLASRTL